MSNLTRAMNRRAKRRTSKLLDGLSPEAFANLRERCKGKSVAEASEEMARSLAAHQLREDYRQNILGPGFDAAGFKANAGVTPEEFLDGINEETVIDVLRGLVEGLEGPNGKTIFIDDPAALSRFRGYLDTYDKVVANFDPDQDLIAFGIDLIVTSENSDIIVDNCNDTLTVWDNERARRLLTSDQWQLIPDDHPMLADAPHLRNFQTLPFESDRPRHDAVGGLARSLKKAQPSLRVTALRFKPKGYVGAEQISA